MGKVIPKNSAPPEQKPPLLLSPNKHCKKNTQNLPVKKNLNNTSLKKSPNNPPFKENLNNIRLKNNPNNSPSNKKLLHKPLKSAILTLRVNLYPHSLSLLFPPQLFCHLQTAKPTQSEDRAPRIPSTDSKSRCRTKSVSPVENRLHSGSSGPGVHLGFSAPEDTKATART